MKKTDLMYVLLVVLMTLGYEWCWHIIDMVTCHSMPRRMPGRTVARHLYQGGAGQGPTKC